MLERLRLIELLWSKLSERLKLRSDWPALGDEPKLPSPRELLRFEPMKLEPPDKPRELMPEPMLPMLMPPKPPPP